MSTDTISYRGYTISIETDSDPSNPRKEWDNFGTMACVHRRYTLGDNQHPSWDDLLETLSGMRYYDSRFDNVPDEIIAARMQAEIEKKYITLPLFLYDHSGITMSTGPFSCGWDSGTVGIIYVSKDDVRQEHSCKRITEKIRQKVLSLLTSEVNTYDEYLTGNVYGYQISNPDGEDIDSCTGYYGYNHEETGLLEAARNAVDCDIQHARKEHFNKIKTYIRNRVPLWVRWQTLTSMAFQ